MKFLQVTSSVPCQGLFYSHGRLKERHVPPRAVSLSFASFPPRWVVVWWLSQTEPPQELQEKLQNICSWHLSPNMADCQLCRHRHPNSPSILLCKAATGCSCGRRRPGSPCREPGEVPRQCDKCFPGSLGGDLVRFTGYHRCAGHPDVCFGKPFALFPFASQLPLVSKEEVSENL